MSGIVKNLSKIHNLHSSGELGFGIVTYRVNGRLGPRAQRFYQLVVIHRGQLRVQVDRETFAVAEGEGILLGPGTEEFFQFSEDSETTHSWCQISGKWLPGSLAFLRESLNRPTLLSPWLLDFMRTGWKQNGGPLTLAGRNRMISAVCLAVWEFCRGIERPTEAVRPWPEALVKAGRVMDEKMAEPLSLDEIAWQAGVSKGHLILLAREHWRATPIESLWQRRLEKSAELLRETGLSIGEVADRTGFGNAFHFSRRFKQRFGQPPREWRQTQWTSS